MNTIINLAKVFGVVAILSLVGCSEGPAEEAGEKIDEVVTDSRNALEDACEDIKQAADAQESDC
ncbi:MULTISPECIES: hypothetical protein [unclassified Motilimonas]|uniref:hypothetical protein n=1 Tax=Motilimonas TaxID=1914248 RepID=UPI001E414329|nr:MULTISPECIES: hypothetical protein [unclassified Motilimonas]MCE0558012.1 hypothetical protein [Motilimonas sp. E26]MDO6526017.1 hypothetical protein [Motilimonas sp. 1_MG-2023]